MCFDGIIKVCWVFYNLVKNFTFRSTDIPQNFRMGKTRGIKDRAKKIFISPVYSTIVLVPLLIVVILVSAAVIMVVERSSESSYKWTYYDSVYYIVTLVTTIGMYEDYPLLPVRIASLIPIITDHQ